MIRLANAYLRGRGRRREYWLSLIAILVAIFAVLEIPHDEVFGDIVDWVSLGVWCLFASRRLRDAGLPFWLAPFPLAVILVGLGLDRAFDVEPTVIDPNAVSVSLFLVTAVAVLVVLVGVLGCLPSRPPKATAGETAEVFG